MEIIKEWIKRGRKNVKEIKMERFIERSDKRKQEEYSLNTVMSAFLVYSITFQAHNKRDEKADREWREGDEEKKKKEERKGKKNNRICRCGYWIFFYSISVDIN